MASANVDQALADLLATLRTAARITADEAQQAGYRTVKQVADAGRMSNQSARRFLLAELKAGNVERICLIGRGNEYAYRRRTN